MDSSPEQKLRSLWGEICDLSAASSLIEWDQETQMPSAGAAARAEVLSTLAGIQHDRFVADELSDCLDRLATESEEGSAEAAMAREGRRAVDRARKIPADLARALAKASSAALQGWQQARSESSFALFRPHLIEQINLKRQEAAALADGGDAHDAYDALLDLFEPGAKAADLEGLFDTLEATLVPWIGAVAESGVVVDESAARGDFPVAAQQAFGEEMARAIGFDFDAGRLDLSTHPFCTGIALGDVRLTWRYELDDFRPALYGILHEAGHGLYEQGLPAHWDRTPLVTAVSTGIHESQSRLWENAVGRSRGFWRWARSRFDHHFPQQSQVDPEALWKTFHMVRPSLIRVEADETTYNLHLGIRFRLERALLSGDLAVDDLPAAWNDAYESLLGLRPENDAEGVLQDIHWAMGAFGYFPTYTIGSLAAVQLYRAAERDLGDLEEAFAAGETAPLLGWLRHHVHRHGSFHSPAELIEAATGKPLSADDFLAELRAQIEAVYDPF